MIRVNPAKLPSFLCFYFNQAFSQLCSSFQPQITRLVVFIEIALLGLGLFISFLKMDDVPSSTVQSLHSAVCQHQWLVRLQSLILHLITILISLFVFVIKDQQYCHNSSTKIGTSFNVLPFTNKTDHVSSPAPLRWEEKRTKKQMVALN